MSQLFHLRYAELIHLLETFNQRLSKVTEDESDLIQFTIVPETDQSIIWKFFIRIKCARISKIDGHIVEENALSLKQFLSVHQSLIEQLVLLEENPSNDLYNSSATVASIADDYTSFSEDHTVTEQFFSMEDHPSNSTTTTKPQIYRSISVGRLSLPVLNDHDCCVCMERLSNLILSCDHKLCDLCFDRWSNESANLGRQTCPICRCDVQIHGNYLLLERPDTNDVKTTIKESLFRLAKTNN